MAGADWLVGTLSRAVAFGTPLLWATLGEICAERAGVVNLGVEGMMILGAFFAFATAQLSGSAGLGLAAAALAGAVAALLHAFLAVTLRANQYVSGLALTMFGLGLAGLLGRGWEGVPLRHPLPEMQLPGLASIPVLGPAIFSGQSVLSYAALALAVGLWVLMFRSRWGIVWRSVGESPAAADALGINVFAVRYLAVTAGGLFAGVAGGFLSVAYRPSWTEGMTAGMGWVAIAITIFAAWNPLRAVWGALLFGALWYLSFRLQAWVAPELLKLMPYAFTILALSVAMAGRGRHALGAPEGLGLAYARGER